MPQGTGAEKLSAKLTRTYARAGSLIGEVRRATQSLAYVFEHAPYTAGAGQALLAASGIIEREAEDVSAQLLGAGERLPVLEGHTLPRAAHAARGILSIYKGDLAEAADNYLTEFSKGAQLTLTELELLPLFLRAECLALLGRSASGVRRSIEARMRAEVFAKRLLSCDEAKAKRLIEREGYIEKGDGAYLERLEDILGSGTRDILLRNWLSEKEKDIRICITTYHHAEAELETSIMRLLQALNESASLKSESMFAYSEAEKLFKRDADGVFEASDRQTQFAMRHALTHIAQRLGVSEVRVLSAALGMCAKSFSREKCLAYPLLEAPQRLYEALGMRRGDTPLWARRAMYGFLRAAFCAIAALAALLVSPMPLWLSLLFASAFALYCYPLSASAAGMLLDRHKEPYILAHMELERGVPTLGRSVFTLCAIASSKEELTGLFQSLEDNYLRGDDDNIEYGMLLDLKCASEKHDAGDDELLACAENKRRELSLKYGRTFYVFTREREFSQSERVYMPKERKRGAVLALGEALRGGKAELNCLGDTTFPQDIRYIITADADTAFEYGAAKRLIGAMLHPLNTPVMENGRVVAGHGIISLSTRPTPLGSSVFSRAYFARAGLEAYEAPITLGMSHYIGGSAFYGKGIWDISVLTQSGVALLPKERILSHDHMEGAIAKAVQDPSSRALESECTTLNGMLRRANRWLRGDIQSAAFALKRDALEMLSRSESAGLVSRAVEGLSPLFGLCAFLCALYAAPALGAAAVLLPELVLLLPALGGKDCGYLSFGGCCMHLLLRVSTLACRGVNALRALLRCTVSLLFTHRGFLAWTTSAQSDRPGPDASYVAGAVLGVLFFGTIVYFAPGAEKLSALLCALWVVCPYLAREARESTHIDSALYGYALRTWRFFEAMIGEDGDRLICDNYTQYPKEGAAKRTSPTNIGFALMAAYCAYRLGFVCPARYGVLMSGMLGAIEGLEKYRGHLYNWYDTESKLPLNDYISSVDSGNFMALCLFTSLALKTPARLDANHLRALEEIMSERGEGDGFYFTLCDTLRSADSSGALMNVLEEIVSYAGENEAGRLAGDIRAALGEAYALHPDMGVRELMESTAPWTTRAAAASRWS